MPSPAEGGKDRDPGDSVPPGVAVESPEPLNPEERKVLEKLEKAFPSDRDPPDQGS